MCSIRVGVKLISSQNVLLVLGLEKISWHMNYVSRKRKGMRCNLFPQAILQSALSSVRSLHCQLCNCSARCCWASSMPPINLEQTPCTGGRIPGCRSTSWTKAANSSCSSWSCQTSTALLHSNTLNTEQQPLDNTLWVWTEVIHCGGPLLSVCVCACNYCVGACAWRVGELETPFLQLWCQVAHSIGDDTVASAHLKRTRWGKGDIIIKKTTKKPTGCNDCSAAPAGAVQLRSWSSVN